MALAGVGTVFKRSTTSTGALSTIAEINSIDGPTMTRNTIDTTALDTSGGYRTFITGFRDAGTLTLNMNYTEDGYIAMKTDFESNSENLYQITLPSPEGTVFDMNGLVTDLPIAIPTDDKITMTVTIKISGQVTVSSA